MAENQPVRLRRPGPECGAAFSLRPVRHLSRLLRDARLRHGQLTLPRRFWHAALLAGCRRGAAELDHRRRYSLGAARSARGGIQGGGTVLRLSIATADPGRLAPEHRLSARDAGRLSADARSGLL